MRRFPCVILAICWPCPSALGAHSGDKAVDAVQRQGPDRLEAARRTKKNKWEVGATVGDKGTLVYQEGRQRNGQHRRRRHRHLHRAGIRRLPGRGRSHGPQGLQLRHLSDGPIRSAGPRQLRQARSSPIRTWARIYSVAVPKLNACKKPGEWQKFVIDFQAPRFDGKKKTANAKFLKVELNGQVDSRQRRGDQGRDRRRAGRRSAGRPTDVPGRSWPGGVSQYPRHEEVSTRASSFKRRMAPRFTWLRGTRRSTVASHALPVTPFKSARAPSYVSANASTFASGGSPQAAHASW